MKDELRLFVGVRISMAALDELTQLRSELAGAASGAELPVKWVAPASYHVTLQFLGWSRIEVIEALRDRIGDALAGTRRFSFGMKGLGAFPRPDKARVIWAGIEPGGDQLGGLAETVGRVTEELGFPREKRAFHPHVTLGRLKKPADVTGLLAKASEQSFSETSVGSVILFESIMKSSGSEYVERASWVLE